MIETISRLIYATIGTGTVNDAAHIDFPIGHIIGIQISVMVDLPTSADDLRIEVSTQSVNQIANNDALGVLAIAGTGVLTSGVDSLNSYAGPMNFRTNSSQRLYLHYIAVVTTGTATARILFHWTPN